MEAKLLYEEFTAHTDTIGAYRFTTSEEESQFRFQSRQEIVGETYEVIGDPRSAKCSATPAQVFRRTTCAEQNTISL